MHKQQAGLSLAAMSYDSSIDGMAYSHPRVLSTWLDRICLCPLLSLPLEILILAHILLGNYSILFGRNSICDACAACRVI